MLVAGHDTTAYTMQFLLFELARNPHTQHQVRAEAQRVLGEAEHAGGLRYDGCDVSDLMDRPYPHCSR